jgi:quercetin dioxygenase-like cupin family protein
MSASDGYRAFDLGDVTPPESGIHSRTVHADARTRTILFAFAAGEELSEHTASRPAIVHVLSGAIDLTVAGDEIAGTPGTWLHMAAGTPHALRARAPSLMLLTLVEPPEAAAGPAPAPSA